MVLFAIVLVVLMSQKGTNNDDDVVKMDYDYYDSDFFDVSVDPSNNWIYLNPKGGAKHEHTLIFIHGYRMYSQDMFAGFQWSAIRGFGKSDLAPSTTRIILP